ncbi:hypothetical protein GJ699_30325 [Duganella sp. FT80W]|uniref:Uncharacterized protein n=1 Tax=Duganella guangzhouensis TaxID=2666084 RepID=A0A6I2L920_9BURK|nr:hypothetical protein [Duganella guangzhouensis]MRW94280.1 hypothetical protein [Duganella guangzhouensis]
MTAYINEEILCEAYTKLNIDIFHDKKRLAQLEKELIGFFTERAKFYIGDDVKIRIEFEEGSLITKLKVVGSAAVLVASAIAEYGSFRGGVSQIADDAATLAQSANMEVTFRTRAASCDRISSERRKGIFGRVADLIGRLDNIHADLANSRIPTSPAAVKKFNSITDTLLEWEHSSDKFFGKLTDEPTISCLSAGLLEELEKLPKAAPWSGELTGDSFRNAVANSTATLGSDVSGSAARYEAAIREVKKGMRRRVEPYKVKRT